MRSYDAPTLAELTDRSGLISRQFLWLTAKNRDTGLPEPVGFWNGEDHEDITINAVVRTYYAAGAHLKIPSIITEVGVQVRTLRITMSPLSPEVATALRGYDARHAPVEIHRALYDKHTRTLISEPKQVFTGFLNKISIPTPETGGTATCTLSVVSSARSLTRKLALKKSDESQQLRAGDRLRKHADVSDTVTTYWGENKV